ncbi:MAG: OmpH family outer membrane protein [Gammaproteobacteria bacterium]
MVKRKIRICFIFFAMIASLVVYSVYAKATPIPNKIAVLDVEQVLHDVPHLSVMQDKINNEFGPRKEEISDLEKALQLDIEKLQATKPHTKSKERKKLRTKIAAEKKKIFVLKKDLQSDIFAVQKDSLDTVNKELQYATADLSKEQKITLVFAKSSVLYAPSDWNITQQIVEVLKK